MVITFASHAKGPRFETGRKQPFSLATLARLYNLRQLKIFTPPFLISLAPGRGAEATLLRVGLEPAAPEADTRSERGRAGGSPALRGYPKPAAPEAHPCLELPSCSRQRPAPGVSSPACGPRRPCLSPGHRRCRPAAGSPAPLGRPRDSGEYPGSLSLRLRKTGVIPLPSVDWRPFCNLALVIG